ncbi:hypothetical protein GIS00_12250 [Nakamurella sp. YIM 132087]|uniref:Uncharacterized protein n=1 Tax=Nakamurella alba TaxID=2665158 RepID=A0A7K1FKP3_9ACTN|nr:hypothetical protein [Nakamurella alba]MTD14712.1 hypothetical protein [Nakamurella alba]
MTATPETTPAATTKKSLSDLYTETYGTPAAPVRESYETPRGALPGRAVAALVVAGIYTALSVFGIFQLIALRDEIGSRYATLLNITLAITAVLTVLFVVGIVLVANRRSRILLVVMAAIAFGLAIINLRNGINLMQVINVGLPLAILILMGHDEVKRYFR